MSLEFGVLGLSFQYFLWSFEALCCSSEFQVGRFEFGVLEFGFRVWSFESEASILEFAPVLVVCVLKFELCFLKLSFEISVLGCEH